MRAVRGRLLRRTAPAAEGGLLYVAEQQVQPQHKGAGFKHSPKMDHLVCFLPGEWQQGAEGILTKKHPNQQWLEPSTASRWTAWEVPARPGVSIP